MKQVLQSLTTGQVEVEEVPPPSVQPGFLLVRNHGSAVSVGTERATIQRVRRGVMGEALARPDLVRQVFQSLLSEGLGPTWEKVASRLEQPLSLGYSSAGVVEEVGAGVEGFQVGDPVACAGYGYASHAERICVPKRLCVKIPPGVSWEEAAFTTLGAIALQAVRVADLKIGESVAVVGLGIIGQLVVQAAQAAGCRVFGIDPRPERVAMAQELGIERGSSLTAIEGILQMGRSFTSGHGFDAVLLTAATEEEQLLIWAGELAREKGCVVVLGDVPLKVPRDRFYEKELQLRFARSYGPGRYDPAYERHGLDYPFSYVRWTAQRNMEAFLQLASAGKIRVAPLITHRFPVDEAAKAYELITGAGAQQEVSPLGVLFQYGAQEPAAPSSEPEPPKRLLNPPAPGRIAIGVIGAGRFAGGEILPRLKKMPGVQLVGVATAHGASAQAVARRFGIPFSTTDYSRLLKDPAVQAVVVAVPHHLHAEMVLQSLEAGRHLFMEKPLCLTEEELKRIAELYRSLKIQPILQVGFNRRFSWAARQVKIWRDRRQGPLTILYRINAGPPPKEGWLSDPISSGGRILGELGHFIDLAGFFVGASPVRVNSAVKSGQGAQETLAATLSFADGSLASITYASGGDRSLPKERIELFGGDSVVVVDDFRSVTRYQKGRKEVSRRLIRDKGFQGELSAFLNAVRSGGPSPIPFSELFAATLATFRILESSGRGQPVPIEIPTD